jgi:hypothetical protein
VSRDPELSRSTREIYWLADEALRTASKKILCIKGSLGAGMNLAHCPRHPRHDCAERGRAHTVYGLKEESSGLCRTRSLLLFLYGFEFILCCTM